MSAKVTNNTDEPVKPITLTENDRDLIAELVANEIKKELKELLIKINTDNKTKNKEPRKKNKKSAKSVFSNIEKYNIKERCREEYDKLPSSERMSFMNKIIQLEWTSLSEEKKKEYQM